MNFIIFAVFILLNDSPKQTTAAKVGSVKRAGVPPAKMSCENHEHLTISEAAKCCIVWHARDETVPVEKLSRCPGRRAMAEAKAGFGDDPACTDRPGVVSWGARNLGYIGSNCELHKHDAVHCFRSGDTRLTYKKEGKKFDSRNQCCYDDQDYLVSDCNYGAGTVDKESGLWAHEAQDVFSFKVCKKAGMDELYFERRPCDPGLQELAIVMDTTQSMQVSIEAAVEWSLQLVVISLWSQYTFAYGLIWFGDPNIGEYWYTESPSDMNAELKKLQAGVPDNGDDANEQCFLAMLRAIDECSKFSKLVVFTDNPSKRPDLYPAIVSMANYKKVSIYYLMHNAALSKRKRRSATSGFELYRAISRSTGGLFISITGDAAQISKVLEHVVGREMFGSTHFYRKDVLDLSKPVQIPINVMNSIKIFQILLVSNEGHSLDANLFSLIDPRNSLNKYKVIFGGNNSLILLESKGKKPGIWKLKYDGAMGGSVSVIGRTNTIIVNPTVEFTDAKTGKRLKGNPMKKRKCKVKVRCSDCEQIQLLELFQCTTAKSMKKAKLRQDKKGTGLWIGSLKLPESSFCIKLSGLKDGKQFVDIAKSRITPISIEITAHFKDDNNKAMKGTKKKIDFIIKNRGEEKEFLFRATDRGDFAKTINPRMAKIKKGNQIRGTIEIDIDKDTEIDSSAVQISAVANDSPEETTTVTLRLTIIKSGKDHHALCCSWAKEGLCHSNALFMRPLCQRSCGTYGCRAEDFRKCKVSINTEDCS